MEVRPGYKQTEVGVIPEEWEVRRLGDVADLNRQSVVPASQPNQPFVHFSFPAFDESKNAQVELGATIGSNKFRVPPNAVLLSKLNPRIPRIWAPKDVPENACASTEWLVLTPRDGTERVFLFVLCSSGSFCQQMELAATGTTGSHQRISPNTALDILVAVPVDEKEQTAIAGALSDVDALLAGLDRLIAKKRDLKQAAMQQLLTGQTRLPGFSGAWEVKRLGEVLAICHGRSQRDVEAADGPYPILATGGQIGTATRPLYEKPSVLIGRKGTINKPQYMDTPFWTVDTLFYSEMKGSNSARFFFYLFCTIDWMQFNEASGVPSLNARTIENIEIDWPQPREQTLIAAVLFDMDAELTALEARRDKTRDLKQAMMQELLTGRTRLI